MDRISKEKRSKIMSKIHQPTKLEKDVFAWFDEANICYEKYPKIGGNPDAKILTNAGPIYVFIDGCFWHCCPTHYRRPKSRQEFWVPHVEHSNERREERRRNLPYKWIRVWEHEVRDGTYRGRVLDIVG